MSRRANKKRKLNDASSEVTSTSSSAEYNFTPFTMRTITQDLATIPPDILIRSLIHSSRTDVKFLAILNKSIEHIMHPSKSEEEETSWFANFIDKNAKPNACEYRPINPTKIRKYVLDLFDSYEWRPPSEPGMWNDWIPEADHRESTYNRFIALLNRIIKKAKDLAAAGENSSAYIILRVLEDVATPNRFDNNGDLSPDEENEDAEELDLDMTPEEFFEELGTALDDVTEKLSDAETKYCEKRLKGYQEALPKEKYNKEAFKAFPLTVDGVKSMFDSKSYARADDYVGRFYNIKSLIETNNKQKIYEIHSQIGAVSMSGEYYQTITFNNKKIIDSDCSCPVGEECKHLAALMLTICNKKKQRQA